MDDIDTITTERLFCLALLPEGTDIVERVLGRFLDYRRRKDEVLAEIGCEKWVKKKDNDKVSCGQ